MVSGVLSAVSCLSVGKGIFLKNQFHMCRQSHCSMGSVIYICRQIGDTGQVFYAFLSIFAWCVVFRYEGFRMPSGFSGVGRSIMSALCAAMSSGGNWLSR